MAARRLTLEQAALTPKKTSTITTTKLHTKVNFRTKDKWEMYSVLCRCFQKICRCLGFERSNNNKFNRHFSVLYTLDATSLRSVLPAFLPAFCFQFHIQKSQNNKHFCQQLVTNLRSTIRHVVWIHLKYYVRRNNEKYRFVGPIGWRQEQRAKREARPWDTGGNCGKFIKLLLLFLTIFDDEHSQCF